MRLADDLLRESPDIGTIIVECTVVHPYSHSIHEATRLSVYDITTLVRTVHSTVDPTEYR